MKLKDTDRKVLNYLYSEYRKRHGSSIANFDEFSIFIMDDGLRQAVPELYSHGPELEGMKAVFRELSSRGLVKVHGNFRDISLTEEGFKEASKTWWRRSMEFLNANQGLVILILLVSLVVSVIPFCKGTN